MNITSTLLLIILITSSAFGVIFIKYQNRVLNIEKLSGISYLAYKKFNGLWRKKVFFDKYEKFIKGKTKVKFKKGIIQI